MFLQVASRSWRNFSKQFKYQKQQLSVACVWPTWGNHSLETAYHASNESLDLPVPRELLAGPDVAKSPPVACSKHARSGWDQVSMFGDVGILKSLPTSSPHSSTSICKVKTVHWLIGEEYRIPIVISPLDVILCPVQTRMFVKSGQGNANACSPRPKTTL